MKSNVVVLALTDDIRALVATLPAGLASKDAMLAQYGVPVIW